MYISEKKEIRRHLYQDRQRLLSSVMRDPFVREHVDTSERATIRRNSIGTCAQDNSNELSDASYTTFNIDAKGSHDKDRKSALCASFSSNNNDNCINGDNNKSYQNKITSYTSLKRRGSINNSVNNMTTQSDETDITSSLGVDKQNTGIDRENENSGSNAQTPLMLYLQQIGDSQREALERVYDRAVEMPCQTLTRCNDALQDLVSPLLSHFNNKNVVVFT